MPQPENSSQREHAIGTRLRQLRESKLISRTAFALSIGIGYQRLESYEAGRVPLPYGIYKTINAKYFFTAQWLVTGEGPAVWFQPFDESRLAEKPSDREPLSTAYARVLAAVYEKESIVAADEVYGPEGILSTVGEFMRRLHDPVEAKKIPQATIAIVRDHLREWADALARTVDLDRSAKHLMPKRKRPSRRRGA